VLLVWAVKYLCADRVLVCPEGLVRQTGRHVESCRWTDLAEVIHKEGEASLHIVRKDGSPWPIEGKDAARIAELAQRLRDEAGRHAIAWKTE
jgi:hypothetical protein